MVFSRVPSFESADTCMPVFTLHLGRYYLEFMNKLRPKKIDADATAYKPAASSTIRAMTYNIHSCVNTDGAVGLEQVAKVISQLTPDLVALQEVDAGIPRTHYQDQAKTLGEFVDMDFRFFPVVKKREQKYGLAVLSRLPIQNRMVARVISELTIEAAEAGCYPGNCRHICRAGTFFQYPPESLPARAT